MRLQRDALGQLTHEELAPGLNRQLRYNSDGLLTEQSLHAGNQGLFATRYDYDRAGNLTSRHDSAFGKDTYLYDPMGRILKHTDPQGVLHEFCNDPAGDRLITQVSGSGSASTVVGRNDEWQRQGSYQGTHYRFDRAGNLTHKQDSQQRLELAWDANQRLIASRRTTKEAAPSVTTYGYDPLGRRLFKETQGQRTWFGWDGDAMTLDVIDGQAREFIYRPETFEPLAVLGQTAQGQQLGTLHYVNDPNGCPTRLINGKGQVLWAASYSAWGAVDKLHASAVSNPIRLQGQYEDGETELYYNRHRYYDTHTESFISRDPIGLQAGDNFYRFGPSTLNWIDPSGLSCKSAMSGKKGRTKAIHDLERNGFKVVSEEVTMKVNGKRIRADFVAKDGHGKLHVFEVKHGSGRLTTNQKASGIFDMSKPANTTQHLGGGAITPSSGSPGKFTVDTHGDPGIPLGGHGATHDATFNILSYN
jgi:RHS repeat-associated protein